MDEREVKNQIDHVAAAPDQLLVLRTYQASAGEDSGSPFEDRWRNLANVLTKRTGCMMRLHRALTNGTLFTSYEVWPARASLVDTIQLAASTMGNDAARAVTDLLEATARAQYLRLTRHIAGTLRGNGHGRPKGVVTLRHFYLKVGSEAQFERLWTESAQAEAQQSQYKRLHRDLHLPTHYVSYTVWPSARAADEAAHTHGAWQATHEPYPLVSPVLRETLAIRAQFSAASNQSPG